MTYILLKGDVVIDFAGTFKEIEKRASTYILKNYGKKELRPSQKLYIYKYVETFGNK